MKSYFLSLSPSRHLNFPGMTGLILKNWLIFLFIILIFSTAFAQIPHTISYQGVLTDTTGNPKPDGNYSFTFSLYETSAGGNAIWSESKTLTVTKGLFSTLLGDQTPFSDTLKFDKPYWLGIKVGNDPELSPRIALTSAGYSFSSINSDTAKNIIDGKVVKSLNGLKDNVKLMGDGGTTVKSTGDTIMISSISSGGGIQGVKSTNGSLDITNPNGPTATINADIPNIINGNAVKSINGLKNDISIKGSGGTSVNTSGDTIRISSSNSSETGIKGIQNTNNSIDITNPNGPTATLNVKLPVSSSVTSDTAKNIIDGKVVKSLNGLKDDVTIVGTEGTTVNHSGNTITISSSSGGIQKIQNTNSTIDVTNPNGPSSTINLKVPLFLSGLAEAGYYIFGTKVTKGNGWGIWGYSPSGTGVYGQSDSWTGVYGTSNSGKAVWGNSPDGTGVYGQSSNNTGVYGITVKGNGLWGYSESGSGVFGQSASGTAIYGQATTTNGYAGKFDGNVAITGDLNVGGSKHFKIDDPIDPANKYLVHSSVESPDQMDIYNGNVTTGADGSAIVELPEYFQALNINYRYQLTTIGQQAQAWIESEIQNNQFTIKTNRPNVKVSWQVTGIRNDPYAKAHPMVVEQEKKASERGKYIHPELYGQSKEDAIGYVKKPEVKTVSNLGK